MTPWHGDPDGWRVGDQSSRLLLDIAAGRSVQVNREMRDDEIELATHHGLIGLMARSTNPVLRTPAQPLYAMLAARQTVMRRHLRQVLTELARTGIPATVLKGPNLGLDVYEDPIMRTYTDIDLLIPADQLDPALDLIAANPAVPSIPPKGPKADKRDIRFRDESGVSFSLDLHWDLFSYSQLRGCARGATRAAWKRSTGPVDIGLGPVWRLPDEARCVFLCCHAVLDHRFRLILFRDLAEVCRKGVDWDRLGDFAESWRLRSTTYVALLMASRLVDAAVPDDVLRALRPRSVPVGLAEQWLGRTDLVRFDGHRSHPLNLAMVLLHDSRRDRLALLAHAPFAFRGWQRRVEGLPRRRSALMRAGGNQKHVLILVSSDRRRGAEVFGERLSLGLSRLGWKVDLVSLASLSRVGGTRSSSTQSADRVGRFDLFVIRGLRKLIRERHPDIVFANGAATLRYGIAGVFGMRPRPRLVYASIGEPRFWLRNRWHRLQQRLLHRRLDMVLAVSEATRAQVADTLGVDESRLRVAKTGVPADFLEVAPSPPEDVTRLLFLGNLSLEKDPETALELIAELAQRRQVVLKFVGDGALEGSLRRTARSRGLDGIVTFAGSVDDVRPHLAWADVLILTSKTEGFPTAILEAAAAAVPAVAFDVGGTREAIVDGETGLLIPPGDTRGFVEAVERLTLDADLRSRLGDHGRQRVAESFTLARAVEEHAALLTEVIGGEQVDQPEPE